MLIGECILCLGTKPRIHPHLFTISIRGANSSCHLPTYSYCRHVRPTIKYADGGGPKEGRYHVHLAHW